MTSQLFALYDSPRSLWLAQGSGAIVRKCLVAMLKATLAFLVFAAVMIMSMPEYLTSPPQQAQLLFLWFCLIGIGLAYTFRIKSAIGSVSCVSFDRFTTSRYDFFDYEEVAFVTIRYHRVGVAHYTFTAAKPRRQLREFDLFVRESLEQSRETKATLEGKEVMVTLEELP